MRTDDKEYQEYLQEKFLPGRRQYLEWLIYPRYLRELPPGAPVWDLGFGNGEFLDFCRKRGIDARGIDSNPHFVATARSRGLAAEVDNIVTLATVPDNGISAALSDNVLEHLGQDDLPHVFRTMDRKLAPGGTFLVVVPGEKGFAKDPTHATFVDAALVGSLTSGTSLRLERSFRWPVPSHWISTMFYLNMTIFTLRKRA